MTVRVINVRATEDVLRAFTPEALASIARDIAEGARQQWVMLAQRKLRSSQQDYIAGIQEVEMQGGRATIALVGVVANLVEQGMDPFDLHDTILNQGTSFHTAADGGRYLAIPFRHKTPGSGPGGGVPMTELFARSGALSAAHSEAIGKEVYARAKKLRPGERLPAGLAGKMKSFHTTDPFAGMQRGAQKKAGGGTQGTYTTFRTISVGPGGEPRPEAKWLHPGVQPRHLADEVGSYVDRIAGAVINKFVASILGGGR
jgi:hypothetical protein